MKTFIISLLLTLFLFSGCADKRIVLVPQAEYYPTFPTQDFRISQKYPMSYWAETEDVNGTTITYLVADEKDLLGFIKNTKELRTNYNVLLKKLNMFNLEIQEQNRIQNEKKPTEVEDIKDSWFK